MKIWHYEFFLSEAFPNVIFPKSSFFGRVQWNVTPLLGDFGGRVGIYSYNAEPIAAINVTDGMQNQSTRSGLSELVGLK